MLATQVDAASTVRGKLIRENSSRSSAAPGLLVRLVSAKGVARTTYSASDGMFYFYNIPAGPHTLLVHDSDKQVQTYQIKVEDRPFTDIAPIRVPRADQSSMRCSARCRNAWTLM
jgi:hypothetical protein